MKKKLSSGLNVGSSSILVTFVLLCLVTFAALSFLSADSDYRLSRQTADRTTDFYEANQIAEIYMANIEALLAKQYSVHADESAYYQAIPSIFSDNDHIFVNTSSSPVTLHYSIAINKTQDLQVCLSVHYPNVEDSALFHIQEWRSAVNDTWQENTAFPEEETGLMIFE